MRILAGACAAFVALTGAAAAFQITPELKAIIEEAKKEKVLEASAGPQVLAGPAVKEKLTAFFKNEFGVDVDFRFTPGGPMGVVGQKIATEFRAGQPSSTDLWTGAAPQVVPLLKLNMFRPVPWAKLYPGRITDALVDGDGFALKMTTGMPGIIYNPKVGPEFAKVDTLDDLLKPEFKGKFATTSFAAAFDVLLSKEVWGEEKTIAYMEKFAKQIAGINNCGGEQRIVSGEFPALVLDCALNGPNQDVYKGAPLAGRILRDNAQNRPYYVLVPKHAAHPNMGILYAIYMSSVEGQDLNLRVWGNDLAEYPNSVVGKIMADREKDGVQFRDVSISWWQRNPGIDEANNKLAKIIRDASR